ncbi:MULTISPECIES: hypothetical protein [Companilactobacillus]|uniref:hypothetical protein n=1 Tax=Companilactobacillus TaxID=2767879 RepID=UPI0013DE2DF2|nr:MULTISPECIES: hypothetical protein [Companilactobacillus]
MDKNLIIYTYDCERRFKYIGDIYEDDDNLEFAFIDEKTGKKFQAIFKMSEIIGYVYQE